jgi:hypothetical protein
MSESSVFISYSWDNGQHKQWVRQLATNLQENGVRVRLDQWDTYLGADLPEYMEKCVRECEFVILVCTPAFCSKANAGTGGVGYEKMIVTGEVFSGTASSRKFIPLLREGIPKNALPSYLKSKEFVDFRSDADYQKSLERLLRHIYSSPKHVPPPLGPRPDLPAEGYSLPTTQSDAELVYCPRCGSEAGLYSSCLDGGPHAFTRFTGKKDTIFCRRCGTLPGHYSSCLGGDAHQFVQFGRAAEFVFCRKCGKHPGLYSSCLAGDQHDYQV